ncbi:MAG: acyl--CoA ligase [Ignavibacteria bacterium]|nr:acyl--CoA ligase [Ignavibacteria bacterium]
MVSLSQKITAAQSAHGIAPDAREYPFTSIADALKTHSALGDKPFLIYYNDTNTRSEMSYADFAEAARKTAQYLHQKGITRGDRIATAAHNHPDSIVQYFAAWLIGACIVPLNMTEDDSRLQYILENSESKIVFCRQEYCTRIESVLGESQAEIIPVYDNPNTANGFHTLIAELPPLDYPTTNALHDDALIVYTSGTTGNPKGVVLMQRNLIADGIDIAEWHGIDTNSRMMCVLPIHHVNGCIVTHVTPFLQGASVVLNRKFQTELFFDRIIRERVNVASVVPTLLAFLLDKKVNASGAREAGFRHIICGAGPLTCELVRGFEEHFNFPVVHGYGLSETTCYTCFLPADLSDVERRHWLLDFGFPSIGVPLPCNEMAICDPEGNPLPEMERGEICTRGANVMREYFNNPPANESAFTFGWFRSGDEGFYKLDERGRPFFFITGRIKELIIRGGVNLAPLEIDEIIARAPGVKAGICVGFENNFYGEEVGALVIPMDESANEKDILDYCAQHLPYHKSPKVVVFTDHLPVTSTGKYQRNKVKHVFAEWKAVQFRKEK